MVQLASGEDFVCARDVRGGIGTTIRGAWAAIALTALDLQTAAQAPNPIGVMCRSLVPSCLVSTAVSSIRMEVEASASTHG